MKKQVTAITASLAMLCGMYIPASAATFSDIGGNEYAWCASQIEEMADAGYVHGYEDGTFKPDNEVTKLEGIALFARVMGSDADTNAEALELAHMQYDSAIKNCNLDWGDDEIAFMMYKGALSASDLTTYIMDDAKDKPMTRGEAAIIITKAMGGESVVAQTTRVELTYLDSNSIPKNLLPYVQYVTQQGIMNGIDDEFRAGETVTRAQIAVMLQRVSKKCDYSFERGKLLSVDEDEMTVKVSIMGEEATYPYTDNTGFYIAGDAKYASAMPESAGVIITFSGDDIVSIDALSDQPETTITVIYSGYSSSGGVYTIRVKDNSTDTTTKSYTCIEDVPITYKNSPATIKSLQEGDALILELANGKVQSITGTEKTETVTGATISDIQIDGETVIMTIASANSAYDGKSYPVADDATAEKANKTVDMNSIYVGDTVTLKIRYGKIISVSATSTYSTVSGIIDTVTISNNPSITVKVDGKEKTYQVPVGCDITVNQQPGSLYDFRVGDSVTLTTQSSAVTKIQVSTSMINNEETGGSVVGTVSAVNTGYGFIGVMMDGYDVPVPVYKTSNQTTIITTAGKTLDFKAIKVGDTVECRGTTSNGAFVATLIIVTQK